VKRELSTKAGSSARCFYARANDSEIRFSLSDGTWSLGVAAEYSCLKSPTWQTWIRLPLNQKSIESYQWGESTNTKINLNWHGFTLVKAGGIKQKHCSKRYGLNLKLTLARMIQASCQFIIPGLYPYGAELFRHSRSSCSSRHHGKRLVKCILVQFQHCPNSQCCTGFKVEQGIDWPAAADPLRQALKAGHENFGTKHPDVIRSRGNLATNLHNQG